MKLLFTSILLLSLNLRAKAQDSTFIPRSTIALNAVGVTGLFGFTYEVILQKRLNLEAGVGMMAYGGGVSYYLTKVQNKKFNPYFGIKSLYSVLMHDNERLITYVPIGVSYLNDGFYMSIDLGPSIHDLKSGNIEDERNGINFVPHREFKFHGNVKFGFRFQTFQKNRILSKLTLKELLLN